MAIIILVIELNQPCVHLLQNHQPDVYMNLAEKAVKYAQGNPLALKVMGSNLYNKSMEEWGDELEKLESTSDDKILKILKVSYNDLDDNQKQIFLDIACFFKSNDKDHVESILNGCSLFARTGISRLLDKCLITVSNKKLEMHDLLQEMGKDIVRRECVKKPGKRSRLWNPKDIYNVLRKDLVRTKCVATLLFFFISQIL